MSGRTGGTHSITFPDPPPLYPDPPPSVVVSDSNRRIPKKIGKAARPRLKPPAPNLLEVYANGLRDVETIRDKLRNLVVSGTRHGDLQVALSAARRLADSLAAMIDAEEVGG